MGFSCLLRWKELLLHCAAKSDGPSEGLGGLPTAIAVHSAPEGLVFSLLLTRSKQARPYTARPQTSQSSHNGTDFSLRLYSSDHPYRSYCGEPQHSTFASTPQDVARGTFIKTYKYNF